MRDAIMGLFYTLVIIWTMYAGCRWVTGVDVSLIDVIRGRGVKEDKDQ